MKSYIVAGTNSAPSTSATNYNFVHASIISGTWNATQTNRDTVVPHAMTIDRLHVVLTTAPGTGKSYTFTLVVNAVDSALTCTIQDAATSGADNVNTVSVSAGDLISIKCVPSGTPGATGNMWWNMRQDATNLSAIIGGSTQNVSNSAVNYNNLMSSTSWNATLANVYSPMPTSGVIKNLYIVTSAAPGAAKSYTFDIMKNGSTTGVQVVISGGAQTTGNDSTNTVSVAAGDTIAIQCTPSGTPTAANIAWACSFDPDTDGESVILYGDTGQPSQNFVNYIQPLGRGANTTTTTEANAQFLIGASTLKSMYALLSTNLGGGQLVLTLRDSASDTTASITFNSVATSGNITGLSYSFSDDHNVALKTTPTTTWTNFPSLNTGFCIFIDPGTTPTAAVSTFLMMGIG